MKILLVKGLYTLVGVFFGMAKHLLLIIYSYKYELIY